VAEPEAAVPADASSTGMRWPVRGKIISAYGAKAGQTGSVSSPQLHFEVRKGATAMDPIKFLSSATASN
jgi:septal ring factor EnvC (AmiA/AmiB activator)